LIVRFLFLLFPVFLNASLTDWFFETQPGQPTTFHCPHQCGEWGSESIRKVEWLAVLALYEIDKMGFACKDVTFPYHLPPNDKEDLWYKNAYPRWIQVEMPMNSQPIPGCKRAFPITHRSYLDRLSSCSYCQASEESPAYSWCFSHTTRGDIGREGTTFEVEYVYYNYLHNQPPEDDFVDCWDIAFDDSKSVFLFSDLVLNDFYQSFMEERHRFVDKLLSYMDTVHEALTKQRIEEEGKIANWNTLLQNLPVKETIKTGEYQKKIKNSKRWIELVNGDLGQLKDEKLRVENKSQRYDTIFETHMPLIKKRLSAVVNEYTAIFDQCIANHQAPASYFERSRIHYEWGDAIDCIEDIKTLFEVCPPEYISEELSSKLERTKGYAECEIGLYDEAILTLSNYMKNHPHHERDYLERAIAYFETGQLDQAIEDFARSGFSTSPIPPDWKDDLDLVTGFTLGLGKGGFDSVVDTLIFTETTLTNLPQGLWALATKPKEVSRAVCQAFEHAIQYIKEEGPGGVLYQMFPEAQELVKGGDQLSYSRQGELMGIIAGKVGMEFALLKGTKKGVQIFRELREANASLTLNRLSKSLEARQIISAHQEAWRGKTAALIQEFKNTKCLDKELYKAFRAQSLSDYQVRKILHQAEFKTFRRPKGVPRDAVVKISEKSGGMLYIKPGTTDKQCILVRVMPGNPKSPNPSQRKPYVVQRRGDKAVLGGDKLVNHKSLEAHVPLSEFQFKEW